MATKNRIVYLMQYLQENSDENHPVTTAQIRDEMAKRGCPIIISTLRDDIESLRSAGYDIQVNETEGMSTTYSWLERKWDAPELQVLIDAVCSAQFIPKQKSTELIAKLISMAGPSHIGELRPRILVSEHIKAKNKNMIYTVQEIRRAIDRNKKIRFRYLEYNTEKEQVRKHEGTDEEWYVVSPYATIWNDDRYYLVGWSDKRNQINVYRIDRMEVPKQLPNKRVPEPEGFDIRDYTDKVFRMYGGPEEKVTLQCSIEILDQVIDRFGDRIEIMPGKKCFTVTVPVSLSTTFYAWVFQYVGKMGILTPKHVREAYAGYLEEALDEVLGGAENGLSDI